MPFDGIHQSVDGGQHGYPDQPAATQRAEMHCVLWHLSIMDSIFFPTITLKQPGVLNVMADQHVSPQTLSYLSLAFGEIIR